MTAVEILIDLIKRSEGCKLKAYKCPAGVCTIGYGITGPDIIEGLTWTQEQADQALTDAAYHVLDEALYQSKNLRSATESQKAAIADFVYNLGVGAYRASSVKRCIDASDFQEAKHVIMKWNKARINGKLTELPGLTKRRQAESDLL